MKSYFHPDYWIEIPAGEYFRGLSEERQALIRTRLYEWANYDQLDPEKRDLTEGLIKKYNDHTQLSRSRGSKGYVSMNFTREERVLMNEEEPFATIIQMEMLLIGLIQQQYWVDRFYISRFPLTRRQYKTTSEGPLMTDIPGVFEADETRKAAQVSNEGALWFCQNLGVRLPTNLEWLKAARGPQGYLYPWGDDWNPTAGHFYYGQGLGRKVDAYPQGASPYGVEFMAGGLPELAMATDGSRIMRMGCHARNSSEETAWLDHLLILQMGGGWTGLRPAMSQWPKRLWSGFWTPDVTLKEKPLISRLPNGIPNIELKSITAGSGGQLKLIAQLKNDDYAPHEFPRRTFSLVWSLRKKRVALINDNSELWFYQSGSSNDQPIPIDQLGYCGAFSPDDQFLAFGYDDNTVRLWEITAQATTLTLATEDRPRTLAFSPDQRFLAAGDDFGTLYIWDISQGAAIRVSQEHRGDVKKIIFSPDGRWLVSAGKDNQIHMWDMNTQQLHHTLTVTGPTRDLAFSHDSLLLFSADSNGIVNLWDIQAKADQEPETLRDPNGNFIISLSINPTGKLLATGQTNGTFSIWNLQTKEIARVVPCYGKWIDDEWAVKVAFSSNGTMLATYNRGAVIWGIPAEEPNAR